jgi:tetratricopeptide (TPR) repeat protein
MRDPVPALALATLFLLPRTVAPQDQNDKIDRKLQPSVVAIRNAEGYGSGMILDSKGLLLTNAHVVCSPLPFHVQAVGTVGGETKALNFNNVSLLGVHPEYDLALLQIDLGEHRATVKPVTTASAGVSSGDPVWAMGFPADINGGRTKFLTWGKVTSTNRIFQGDPYIEMDVSLYYGNSGGPVSNGNGDVVGVATALAEDGSTLAVPIGLVRPERFVSLKQRAPNHKVSTGLISRAEKEMDGHVKGRGGSLATAITYYEKALVYDAGNPALYAKIAEFNYLAGRQDFAFAYYVRSLQIQPWPDSGPDVYRQLGLCLTAMKKPDAAITIWREGLRKYPADNALLWDELAILMMENSNPLEAACAARTALKCFTNNADVMNEVYKASRERMTPADVGKLRLYENNLETVLAQRRVEAEVAKREGKEFLTAEMERLVRTFTGVQQSGTIDLGKLGFRREQPKLTMTDSELTQLFVRSRVDVAGEHLRAGNIALATKTLEDVIKTYPHHPEAEYARELLSLIRKQKK